MNFDIGIFFHWFQECICVRLYRVYDDKKIQTIRDIYLKYYLPAEAFDESDTYIPSSLTSTGWVLCFIPFDFNSGGRGFGPSRVCAKDILKYKPSPEGIFLIFYINTFSYLNLFLMIFYMNAMDI